jgi:hypothetical protein
MSAGPHAILWPAFALVALTFLVWLRMFSTRVGEMRRLRIDPQSVATASQAAQRFVDTRAADNFRNLFEMPVLFYVAIVMAHVAAVTDGLLLALAWSFVVLRFAHSAIQCSYNRVMHRFYAYLAASLVLWALWGALAFALLAHA